MTVNTNHKQSELEYQVKHSDMHTLLITEGTWDSNYVDMVYEMLPELKECMRASCAASGSP